MIPCFAAVALPCMLALAQPVELSYRYDRDHHVRYELVQHMEQSQTLGDKTVGSSTDIVQKLRTELLETREDGSLVIGNTQESIAFKIVSPSMKLDYDSQDPLDQRKLSDPTVASISALNGLQVRLDLGPDGTINDILNIDELVKGVDGMDDPGVRAAVRPMMQKDALVAMNEMNYRLLPSGPVEIGDAWTRSFDVPFAFGALTVVLDLTLDDVVKKGENERAKISIEGRVEMPTVQKDTTTTRLTKSTVSGSLLFDVDAGEVASLDMSTVMHLISTRKEAPMPFLIEMSQKVRLKRID